MAVITKQQQRRLKELLGRPVPKDYLDLLRRFPAELAAKLARHQEQPDERLLFTDVATVVAQNEEVRTEDIWTEEGPWPPGHLVIGSEIGGDKWSLSVKDRRIYRLMHESGTLEEQAPGLTRWFEAVERYLDGDDQALEAAAPTEDPAGLPPLPKARSTREANIQKYLVGWIERHDKAIAKKPSDPQGWKDRARLLGNLLFAEHGHDCYGSYLGAYRLLFADMMALGEAAVTAHEDWLKVVPDGTEEHGNAKDQLRYVSDAHAELRAGRVERRRQLLQSLLDETGDDYYRDELGKLS